MLATFYTNRGPRRESNQDAVLLNGTVYTGLNEPQSLELDQGIFAVADGVGGYKGGELAASLLLESLSRADLDQPFSEAALSELCARAAANMAELAAAEATLASMAATLAGVVIRPGQLALFNCGDCRVYRFSKPYLAKLSHDHSAVQALFDSGLIDEDEMRLHPRKHIITAAIGPDKNPPDIFFKPLALDPPYTLFICSDGVWEALPLDRLEDILCQGAAGAAALATELFSVNASDNISFIIIQS